MIPILYQTTTEGTVPTSYGIGALTDAISCTVKEERNGSYELALQYPADGIHAEELQPLRLIKAQPNFTDNPQLFRIYKVGKNINGSFTVNAQHISYDLSGKVIQSGTANSCSAACALLNSNGGGFSISTTKSTAGKFKITEPSSVRSWFGGKQGSLLDIYGSGEWVFDNYAATLKQNRGTDRGVTIRYGKNLTELSQELNMSNLVTAVYPFCIVDDTPTFGTKVLTGLSLDYPREIAIDFSTEVDPESGTALTTQLATLATNYIANNNLTQLTDSITLNFEQLEGLTERVDLCDTVHIYVEALGITATAKCVATVWDVLRDRYTSCTFGEAKTNIADTIASNIQALEEKPTRTFMDESVERATQLITGNLGGNVVLHDSDGDGEPDEILIMNTADISTATKVWRWNKNGLGYSSTGYAGTYGLAMTADGQIVADYIKTGTITSIAMNNGSGTFTVDAAGNMKATSAKITGEVSATTFNINGSTIADASEQWSDTSFSWDSGTHHVRQASSLITVPVFKFDANKGIYLAKQCYMYSINTPTLYAYKNQGQNAYFMNLYTETGNFQTLYVNGNAVTGSDRDIKHDIEEIDVEKSMEFIKNLKPVSFKYNEGESGRDHHGFIAQDVKEAMGGADWGVYVDRALKAQEEGTEGEADTSKGIRYEEIIADLVNVVQDLARRIEELGG